MLTLLYDAVLLYAAELSYDTQRAVLYNIITSRYNIVVSMTDDKRLVRANVE